MRATAAFNETTGVADFLKFDSFETRDSVQTLSNAVDVGDPSDVNGLIGSMGATMHFNLLMSKATGSLMKTRAMQVTVRDRGGNGPSHGRGVRRRERKHVGAAPVVIPLDSTSCKVPRSGRGCDHHREPGVCADKILVLVKAMS